MYSFYQGYEIIEYSGFPFRTGLQKLGIVPLHWHADVEILFVLEGRIKVTVGTVDRLLEPGDIIIINSNSVHRTLSLDNKRAVVQIVQFQPDYMLSYDEGLKDRFFMYSSLDIASSSLKSNLQNLLSKLLIEISQKKIGYQLAAQSCLNAVLCQLIRNASSDQVEKKEMKRLPSQCSHIRIQRILKTVEKDYKEKITLRELAEKEGVNENYLSRSFRKIMGCTFQSYLKNYRLQKSINLLINTDKNITEIASECGFADTRTFIHVFKHIYDMPPLRWRKLNVSYLNDSSDNFFNAVLSPFYRKEFNLDLEASDSSTILGIADVISDEELVRTLIRPYIES